MTPDEVEQRIKNRDLLLLAEQAFRKDLDKSVYDELFRKENEMRDKRAGGNRVRDLPQGSVT